MEKNLPLSQNNLNSFYSRSKIKDVGVPIVLSDFERYHELKEKQKIYANNEFFKSEELETYLSLLALFYSTFKTRISSNLSEAKCPNFEKIVEEMLKKLIIIGMDTIYGTSQAFNCHGWALGAVDWLDGSSLNQNSFNTFVSDFKNPFSNIDYSFKTALSMPNSSFNIEGFPDKNEGSIAAYYDDFGNLTHTARYIKQLAWYKFSTEEHEGWYKKTTNLMSFDSENKCVIENFTSKLGEGLLVIHGIEDLMPLYGNNVRYYSLKES